MDGAVVERREMSLGPALVLVLATDFVGGSRQAMGRRAGEKFRWRRQIHAATRANADRRAHRFSLNRTTKWSAQHEAARNNGWERRVVRVRWVGLFLVGWGRVALR